MKCLMSTEDKIYLEPETVAEQEYLRGFAGGTVEIEGPDPFCTNISVLLIRKPKKSE